MDDRSFGAGSVRGVRGYGVRGKQIVYRVIERNGNVYAKVVSISSF